jgi:AAA15 family ATPase/GTPase
MLKRVSIQNFKSLKDVTLDLQKVNLLIGPNNSGKTNFLKAFNFTYQFLDGKKNVADSAHYRKDPENYIDIRFFFDEYKPIDHSDKYLAIIIRKAFDLKEEDPYEVRFGRNQTIDSDNIYLEENDDPGIDLILDYAGKIIVYRPDPNQINKPGPLMRNTIQVDAQCSNLMSFFDYIRDEHFDIFLRIQQDLHFCLPEFDQINFQNTSPTEEQRKIYGDITFKKIGLSLKNEGTIYWAEELSEGTLYLVALLCIINQPNPPKLLLLEEPEKGIHPRRIREVMDFIFRLAEEKDVQIILTTHNENVLNEFTSIPEAVFVFEKDQEGATHVKNLLTDIIEPSRQRSEETGTKEIDFTSNLGENWMYGLLGGVPEEAL